MIVMVALSAIKILIAASHSHYFSRTDCSWMCDDYQNFARASLLPAASLRVNQKSMMMVALSVVESHF
jgi:hypothetical protein